MSRVYTFWTEQRLARLETYLALGYEVEKAAKWLRTTPAAVRAARKRYRIAPAFRQGLSMQQVENLLGVNQRTVERWRDAGALPMRRITTNPGRQPCWLTTNADLMALLENPDYWHTWSPVTITDPHLRTWAQRLRGHVEYLSASEAAYQLGITVQAVHLAVKAGRLAARRDGNRIYIQREDVERYDQWRRRRRR